LSTAASTGSGATSVSATVTASSQALHLKGNHSLIAGHDGSDDELDEQSAAGDVDANIDVDDEYGPPDEYGLSSGPSVYLTYYI
jgi:hypothetical protein